MTKKKTDARIHPITGRPWVMSRGFTRICMGKDCNTIASQSRMRKTKAGWMCERCRA